MFKNMLNQIKPILGEQGLFWVVIHTITGFAFAAVSYFTKEELLFILSLAVAISVDTVLGSLAALRHKKFSSKKMWGPIYKILVYTLGLGSLHITCDYFASLNDNTTYAFIPKLLDGVAFSYVLIREMVSIVENGYQLGVYLLPPNLIKRILEKSEQ